MGDGPRRRARFGGRARERAISRSASAPAKKPGGRQIPNLTPGDRVTHDQFGLGTVVTVDGIAEKTKVKVDFGSSGEKTLLLTYAKLDKL